MCGTTRPCMRGGSEDSGTATRSRRHPSPRHDIPVLPQPTCPQTHIPEHSPRLDDPKGRRGNPPWMGPHTTCRVPARFTLPRAATQSEPGALEGPASGQHERARASPVRSRRPATRECDTRAHTRHMRLHTCTHPPYRYSRNRTRQITRQWTRGTRLPGQQHRTGQAGPVHTDPVRPPCECTPRSRSSAALGGPPQPLPITPWSCHGASATARSSGHRPRACIRFRRGGVRDCRLGARGADRRRGRRKRYGSARTAASRRDGVGASAVRAGGRWPEGGTGAHTPRARLPRRRRAAEVHPSDCVRQRRRRRRCEEELDASACAPWAPLESFLARMEADPPC